MNEVKKGGRKGRVDLEENLQGASSIGRIIKAMRRAHSRAIGSSTSLPRTLP
jgi:hypothetical protein